MTMRDADSGALGVNALAPQTIAGSALNTGDEDLDGYNGALVLVNPGTIDGLNSGSPNVGTVACKIEHADDNGSGAAGSYSECVSADIVGATIASGGVFGTLSSSNTGPLQIGYVGDKRWIKVTLTPTNLGDGGPIQVEVVKMFPRHGPAS